MMFGTKRKRPENHAAALIFILMSVTSCASLSSLSDAQVKDSMKIAAGIHLPMDSSRYKKDGIPLDYIKLRLKEEQEREETEPNELSNASISNDLNEKESEGILKDRISKTIKRFGMPFDVKKNKFVPSNFDLVQKDMNVSDNADNLMTPEQISLLNARLSQVDFSHQAIRDWTVSKFTNLQGYKEWVPCVVDLAAVINGIRNGDSWALKMIDSVTKFPSGILEGNIVDLGQYDECLAVTHGNITGQHCMASFAFKIPHQSSPFTVTLSECIPASCTPQLFREAMNEVVKGLESIVTPMGISVSSSIPDSNCNTAYSREAPDTSDIVVMFIVVLFLLITSLSTVVDYFFLQKSIRGRDPTTAETALRAFSILTNGKKLFSVAQNKDQINCLNGIKFLSMGWVLIGHQYLYRLLTPTINLLEALHMIQDVSKMIILNAVLSVDTFFLMSGLLNVYGCCMMADRSKGIKIGNVFFTYVHRFIRLTPPYMMIVALSATWIYRFGDGPVWYKTMHPAKMTCRSHWWGNLLYINNYLSPDDLCVSQSWYLSADMQMFFFSPLVIYPLWKWPIIGYIILAILTFLSILSPILVSYFYKFTTVTPLDFDRTKVNDELTKLYFPTHTKTISYVIGIFVGYILYRVREKKNLKLRLTVPIAIAGWLVAIALLLYSIYGGHPLYEPSHPYNQLESSLYIGFYRFFWSIGVGWVIFACSTGYGGVVNDLLSLPIFGPLGRLSYCVYLIHFSMIMYRSSSVRTASYFTDYNVLQESLGELPVILGLACLLSFTCESPVVTLEKLIFGGKGKKSNVVKSGKINPKESVDHHRIEPGNIRPLEAERIVPGESGVLEPLRSGIDHLHEQPQHFNEINERKDSVSYQADITTDPEIHYPQINFIHETEPYPAIKPRTSIMIEPENISAVLDQLETREDIDSNLSADGEFPTQLMTSHSESTSHIHEPSTSEDAFAEIPLTNSQEEEVERL